VLAWIEYMAGQVAVCIRDRVYMRVYACVGACMRVHRVYAFVFWQAVYERKRVRKLVRGGGGSGGVERGGVVHVGGCERACVGVRDVCAGASVCVVSFFFFWRACTGKVPRMAV